MKKYTFILLLFFGLFLFHMGCSSSTPLQFASVGDALGQAAPDGDVINVGLIDTDGDGDPDAIDTDGDGDPDVPIDPISVPPTPPADPVDPSDPPIVRDPTSDKCVVASTFAFVSVTNGGTFSYTSLNGAEDLWIQMSSSKGTATVDLSGVTGLKRVFIDHQGNTNRITLKNAEMSAGICNQVSGGSNSEIFQASNSAKVADLISGTGGSNSIDLLFMPSIGLRYAFAGNNHCMSALPGTDVLSSEGAPDHGTFLDDGSTCL